MLRIQKEFYTTGVDGLIGNEDCGQMSAWHVLSAIGIYPVFPGSGYWDMGIPLFDSIEVFQSDGEAIDFIRGKRSQKTQKGFWDFSRSHAEQTYEERFITFPPYYQDILPQRNRVSNDFLKIHRGLHFVWIGFN